MVQYFSSTFHITLLTVMTKNIDQSTLKEVRDIETNRDIERERPGSQVKGVRGTNRERESCH